VILETIVTTSSADGTHHLAPMGVHVSGPEYLILPFRPSRTLSNILATGHAVINATDDVRVFAGCLTGRRDWPVVQANCVNGVRLLHTLSHTELELIRFDDDKVRPRLVCRAVHQAVHGAFPGFNRAQLSVIEASILVSRLDLLPPEKIDQELAFLRIGLEKTAGPRELEAWDWLMTRVTAWRCKVSRQTSAGVPGA
jgi:hypothetical protein